MGSIPARATKFFPASTLELKNAFFYPVRQVIWGTFGAQMGHNRGFEGYHKMPYMMIKGKMPYFRSRIPARLSHRMDRNEIRIPVRTTDLQKASAICRLLQRQMNRICDIMEKENLINNAAKVGEYLMKQLKTIPQIKEVRGQGLMIGLEFEQPVKELRTKLLFEQKVFTGVSGTNVIRLLPPLCLTKEQADIFVSRLKIF